MDETSSPARSRLHVDWALLEPALELTGRPVGPPVLEGDHVYLAGRFTEGGVLKLPARGTRPTWIARIPGVLASPAVTEETVHLSTARGVVTLGVDDGEVLWEAALEDLVPRPPLVVGSLLVAATAEAVVALDRHTGELAWRADVDGRPAGTTVSEALYVHVVTGEEIVSFDLETGVRRWRSGLDAPAVAAPASVGSHVIVATDRSLVTLDARSGERIGQLEIEHRIVGELTVADGVVYACTIGGRLLAVE